MGGSGVSYGKCKSCGGARESWYRTEELGLVGLMGGASMDGVGPDERKNNSRCLFWSDPSFNIGEPY